MSEATCLDFDLSVRAVKRWADKRAEETTMVPAPDPPKQPMRPVPTYPTLSDVLALDVTPETAANRREIDDLARQLLTGTVDWSRWQ